MKDEIYNSVPINKTASMVTQKQPNDEIKGANYNKNIYMSLEKPPTVKFNGKRHLDLQGLSFGKFKVIGLFIKQNPKKKLSWVVQCKCGYYTVRKGNTIRRKVKDKEYDECHRCQYTTNMNKYHNRKISQEITDNNGKAHSNY